jgi:hypothetical protein
MFMTLSLAIALVACTGSDPEEQAYQPGSRVAPQARVGRTSTRDQQTSSVNGPFVSSTLPATGHPTRFKRYPELDQDASSMYQQQTGPGLSPYLNLLRGGNPAYNVYAVQRDRQIYNTGAQTQQINTQLRQATETRPIRPPAAPLAQGTDPNVTPLQRRFQAEQDAGYTRVSDAELGLLREIVRELRSIREGLPNQPPEKGQDN